MPTSQIRQPVWVPAAPLSIQVLANTPEKAKAHVSSIWVPSSHMGESDGIPRPWLWLAQTATATLCKEKQYISVPFFYHSAFERNIFFNDNNNAWGQITIQNIPLKRKTSVILIGVTLNFLYFLCIWRAERQKSPIHQFFPQMLATTRVWPGQDHVLGTQSGSRIGMAEPHSLSHHLLPSRVRMSRNLSQKLEAGIAPRHSNKGG